MSTDVPVTTVTGSRPYTDPETSSAFADPRPPRGPEVKRPSPVAPKTTLDCATMTLAEVPVDVNRYPGPGVVMLAPPPPEAGPVGPMLPVQPVGPVTVEAGPADPVQPVHPVQPVGPVTVDAGPAAPVGPSSPANGRLPQAVVPLPILN